MTDLVPLILCALDDAVRAKSLAAPEDADLAALADGLTLAVDHGALNVARATPASEWEDHVSAVAQFASRVLLGEEDRDDGMPANNYRASEILVARRLADVAASLCVRGMALRREAEALWRAASRLLGMDLDPAADITVDAMEAARAEMKRSHAEVDNLTRDLTAWRTWAKASVLPGSLPKYDTITDNDLRGGVSRHIAKYADEVDALKRKHAEDDRALVEAHARELREAKEAHAKEVADLQEQISILNGNTPPAKRMTADPSYRDAILEACAYECTVYHGPAQGEMRVVVGLRDGKTLGDVAAVLERMGRAPGTYSLREVRLPRPAQFT